MELVGEKKIQALFSELRLADEQTLPSFTAVWNRGEAKTFRPQRAFNLSFVAATALLVCALISLALWSRQWQPRHDAAVNGHRVPTAAPMPVIAGHPDVTLPAPEKKSSASSSKSRAIRLAARRQSMILAANRRATREAETLASWQSPTATLLDSPSDELLKSLPQFSQTVDELKSFLPGSPK
jgi:hypothetical protein